MNTVPVVCGVAASAVCIGLMLSRGRARAAAPLLRPAIVLFGDSITQQSFAPSGWGAAVAAVYQRTADITLRGYSGYNTRWALNTLPAIFPAGAAATTTPALVTVLLGANDANLPAPLRKQSASASRQHVPLDEYVDNLRSIVRAIRATGDGSARVLLITPPPVDVEKWHTHCIATYPGYDKDAEPNRAFAVTQSYAEACAKLGAEMRTPTLDLHAAFAARDDWKALLLDGLHPNADGGKAIADEVIGAIHKFYPELRPSSFFDPDPAKLPLDFPDHKNIDPHNPKASF